MFQSRTTMIFLLAAAILAVVVAWALMTSVESQEHLQGSARPQAELTPRVSDTGPADGPSIAPENPPEESGLTAEARELLDAISPDSLRNFGSDSVRYISLQGGNIGTVDAQGLVDGNPESLIGLLASLSEVTGAYDGLEIHIRRAHVDSDGGSAVYNQVVNGIHVASYQKVNFDADGTVTELSSKIAGPSAMIHQPVIPEDEAIRYAVSKLTQELGFEPSNILVDQGGEKLQAKHPYLLYRLSSETSSLSPYWTISLVSRSDKVDRVAVVDAVSGETTLPSQFAYFKATVCERHNGTQPGCTDSGVIVAWEEDAQGNKDCKNPICHKSRNRNPWDILDRVETVLENNAPTLCCDTQNNDIGGPDGTIDVVTDDTYGRGGGPAYDFDRDAILFPAESEQDSRYKAGVDLAEEDEEGMAHEAGHAIFCGLNDALACESPQRDDHTVQSMGEMVGDMVAVIYTEHYQQGDPWKIGEEVLADPNDPGLRDLSQEQNLFGFGQEPAGDGGNVDPHESSMVYSHIFYKLHTEHNVSMADLTKIVLDIAKNVEPDDGAISDEFDFLDFLRALEEAAARISTGMQQKVDDVLGDMAPVPSRPNVGVIPMGCDGQSCNNYEIVFTGTLYVQSYTVQRALAPTGPWFNYSISMTGSDRGIVHSTEWQTTYWRAKATNSAGSSDWSDVRSAADQCDDDCPFPGFCGPFF